MAEKKHLLLIATGGTIASRSGREGLSPALTGEELVSFIPEARELCDITVLQLLNIDSTDMQPQHWLEISETIADNYESYDGFVIVQGTDTMAYTAAGLSYLIQKSRKPIVLTGSQKPIEAPGTDAKTNLIQSIRFAADDLSCDVSVVFAGKVIAGTRARKQRTKSTNAFTSVNAPLLAQIGEDNHIRRLETPEKFGPDDLLVSRSLDEKVFTLKLTPGIRPDIFTYLNAFYDAVILEAFGAGCIPGQENSFEKALSYWVSSGKILALTTQVPEEGCDFSLYKTGRRYHDRPGVLEGGTMTPEAMLAKLMWALGQTRDPGRVKLLFETPVNHDR